MDKIMDKIMDKNSSVWIQFKVTSKRDFIIRVLKLHTEFDPILVEIQILLPFFTVKVWSSIAIWSLFRYIPINTSFFGWSVLFQDISSSPDVAQFKIKDYVLLLTNISKIN